MPGWLARKEETRLEGAILIDAVGLTPWRRPGRHDRRDHTASYLFGRGDQLIQPGKPRLNGIRPMGDAAPAAERRLRNHMI